MKHHARQPGVVAVAALACALLCAGCRYGRTLLERFGTPNAQSTPPVKTPPPAALPTPEPAAENAAEFVQPDAGRTLEQ